MSNIYFGQTGAGLNTSGITQHELNQIANIGNTTISSSTWPFLSVIDQSLSLVSSPSWPSIGITDSGFKTTIANTTAHLTANRILRLPNYDQDLTYPTFSYFSSNIGSESPHWSLLTSNNLYRWQVCLNDADPDNGSNTGSNFVIKKYLDNTTNQDALKINRATGYATFLNEIQATRFNFPTSNILFGSYRGINITTGTDNIMIGKVGSPFENFTTGTKNIVIGNSTLLYTTDCTNCIAIGDNVYEPKANTITIGNSNHTKTQLFGDVYLSDNANLILKSGSDTITFDVQPMTASRTITLPNADISLAYVPSQFVNTTSTPQFTKLGLGQAAGTEALEITGNAKATGSVITTGLLSSNFCLKYNAFTIGAGATFPSFGVDTLLFVIATSGGILDIGISGSATGDFVFGKMYLIINHSGSSIRIGCSQGGTYLNNVQYGEITITNTQCVWITYGRTSGSGITSAFSFGKV